MITEKEFLQAVDIINEYQKQILLIVKKASKIKNTKTPIDEWLLLHPNISVRLQQVLLNINEWASSKHPQIYYIEDITLRRFIQVRNAGKKSWQEFAEINKLEIQ